MFLHFNSISDLQFISQQQSVLAIPVQCKSEFTFYSF